MNAHTKQQQDNVLEMDFIGSHNPTPHNAHLLALSHILIVLIVQFGTMAVGTHLTVPV